MQNSNRMALYGENFQKGPARQSSCLPDGQEASIPLSCRREPGGSGACGEALFSSAGMIEVVKIVSPHKNPFDFHPVPQVKVDSFLTGQHFTDFVDTG